MKTGARAAVVCVGSELLLDARVDTNGPELESALVSAGYRPVLRLIVGDGEDEIAAALRSAARSAEIVVVSGGLGPTFDDLTREAAASALNLQLERNEEIERRLRARFRSRAPAPPESVYRMADFLAGASEIVNTVGSAPGQFVAGPPAVALLPGVPAELRSMLGELLARLKGIFPAESPLKRVFRIAGLYESEVESLLENAAAGWREIGRTILAAPGDVTFILRSRPDQAEDLERAAADVRKALGEAIHSEEDEAIERSTGRLLLREGLTLATAESCTAGMLASMVTSVPGSSAWYVGGVAAYADRIKETILGVPKSILEEHGAVSARTAAAMAAGARDRFAASCALSITGVAGPAGGTESKPVGLVHIALSAPWGESARSQNFPGDRHNIRLRSCRSALDLLRRGISKHVAEKGL